MEKRPKKVYGLDDLSETQRKIIFYIKKHGEDKGYPPSVREIGKHVGLKSTSSVAWNLNKLADLGFLIKDPLKPRTLRVAPNNEVEEIEKNSDSKVVNLPVLGKITAGIPILAVENIEDTFPVPKDMVGDSTAFMLKVQGESMIGAGILDGDLIIAKRQSHADNGDIIVALINNDATVKTYYKEKDHIRLQPQNELMEPVLVRHGFSVLGKVIGVYRRL